MAEKMYPIKLYLRSLPNAVTLGLSLLMNAAAWIWLYSQIPNVDEQIFLHYNILFGVDYIAPRWQIAILPLTGLVILITNALIGWLLFRKDKFVAYLLNSITVMCHVFLLITASLLVFLNV